MPGAAIPVMQVIILLLVRQAQRFERLLVPWARFHREQSSDRTISDSNVEKQGKEDTESTDTFHQLAWHYRGSCAIAPRAWFSRKVGADSHRQHESARITNPLTSYPYNRAR